MLADVRDVDLGDVVSIAVSWQLLPSTAYVRRTPATSVVLGRPLPSQAPRAAGAFFIAFAARLSESICFGRGQWSECRACAMRAHAPCAPSLRLLMPAVERLWGHGYLPCHSCHEPDPRSGGADLRAYRNG